MKPIQPVPAQDPPLPFEPERIELPVPPEYLPEPEQPEPEPEPEPEPSGLIQPSSSLTISPDFKLRV